MSFFQKVKEVAKAALAPEPVETGTPTPDYCTPKAYEIETDKEWLLLHHGPNRKERRKLETMLRRRDPVETLSNRGSVSRIEYDKAKVKEKLKTAPSNFPIRVAPPELLAIAGQPDPNKTPYIFEPEYWQFKNAMREAQDKFLASLPLKQEPAETVSTVSVVPVQGILQPTLTNA